MPRKSKKNISGGYIDRKTFETRRSRGGAAQRMLGSLRRHGGRVPSGLIEALEGGQGRILTDLEGAGIFGDLWSGIKKYTSRVVDVIRHGKRQDYPPAVRELLARIGDQPIVAARLRRDPIRAPLNIALNLITKGSWEKAKSKYAFDKLFHLGLEVTVRVSDSNVSNGVYIIEKNEVINVAPAAPTSPDTETLPVNVQSGVTLNSLLNGAKRIQGANFFDYDAFRNNCQDFIIAVLQGSGLATTANTAWVKQPINDFIAELPSYTSRFAKIATDIGALANVVTKGRGGIKGGFDADADPRDYTYNHVRTADGRYRVRVVRKDNGEVVYESPAAGFATRLEATNDGEGYLYRLADFQEKAEFAPQQVRRYRGGDYERIDNFGGLPRTGLPAYQYTQKTKPQMIIRQDGETFADFRKRQLEEYQRQNERVNDYLDQRENDPEFIQYKQHQKQQYEQRQEEIEQNMKAEQQRQYEEHMANNPFDRFINTVANVGNAAADIASLVPGPIGNAFGALTTVRDAFTGSGGGSSPRSRFAKQLKAAGVSPNAYLMEAQKHARDAGLAADMLGFSDNDKHKLQIPNHNGTIVRFGAVGLGDHILYTLSGDKKASEHQKRYLARATKIRGKWREDEYSPNSLAIHILWGG